MSPARNLPNDPQREGNIWRRAEELERALARLEAEVKTLQEDKAEGAVLRRKLQAALVEVAASATTKSSSSEVRDLLAEAKKEAAAAAHDDEKEEGGRGGGAEEVDTVRKDAAAKAAAASSSSSSSSSSPKCAVVAGLARRVTELEAASAALEVENADLQDALLATSSEAAQAGDALAAQRRAAAASEAAAALAAENARLSSRLRRLHARAPAVAAAGETLERLRDEAAGLRADNARLAAFADAAAAKKPAQAAMFAESEGRGAGVRRARRGPVEGAEGDETRAPAGRRRRGDDGRDGSRSVSPSFVFLFALLLRRPFHAQVKIEASKQGRRRRRRGGAGRTRRGLGRL